MVDTQEMKSRISTTEEPLEQRSKELAEIGVESVNKTPGDLTGYDCPECQNRGYTLYVREDNTKCAVRCKCMQLRKKLRRMAQAGLSSEKKERNFHTFRANNAWQKALLAGAEAYAQDARGWYLVCGQSGSGKSHLCLAICRSLLEQEKDVEFMSWRSAVQEVKTCEPAARKQRIEQWQKAPFLYIDDLFKCFQTGTMPTFTDGNLAMEILHYRDAAGLPTIISTEWLPEDLLRMDEALAGRILENAGEHVYAVQRDPERNYRLRGGKIPEQP